MIRIRDKKGKVLDFEDEPIIVEILDANGKVGIVLIEQDKNTVKEIKAGDPESIGYAKVFGVDFCTDIVDI